MTALRAGTVSRRHSTLELAPLPSAVSCARLHAVHVLNEWGLRDLADDAAMVVSELITNACEASACLPHRPPVALALRECDDCVIIEAWDRSPTEPVLCVADAEAEAGRGLMIVAALARRWGWEWRGRDKVVWAELALRDVPR